MPHLPITQSQELPHTHQNERQAFDQEDRTSYPGRVRLYSHSSRLSVDSLRGQQILACSFFAVRLLDSFETTCDHVSGRFLELWTEIGFQDVQKTVSYHTLSGTV